MERQDLNGYRTPEEVVRRWDLSKIELNEEDIQEIKKAIVCDTQLSTESTNPVQNKVIANAMNTKVTKITGKGLSTEDYTTEEKEKLENIEENAEVNIIEDIKVNGTSLTPDTDRAVDITVPKDFTHIARLDPEYVNRVELPATTSEFFVYLHEGGTAQLYDIGHLFTANISVGSWYFIDKKFFYYSPNNYLAYQLSCIKGNDNVITLYFAYIKKYDGANENDILSTSTLHIDYR